MTPPLGARWGASGSVGTAAGASSDELRARLFNRSLEVHVLEPLSAPGATFADLPAVDGWEASGPRSYTLAVSDPQTAAPAVARALVGAGADILSLSESHHSLEDVYLELINEDVEAQQR